MRNSASKRLDFMLSHLGLGTRRTIKSVIRNSEVLVNGKRITDPSFHISFLDNIEIDGISYIIKPSYYFMMNKPKGCITSTSDPSEKLVIDYLKDIDRNKNLFPVGRLDKDTEGLIFLTTDGKLAHELSSPNKEKEKVYLAEIDSLLSETEIKNFEKGIRLDDGYITLPAMIEPTGENNFYRVVLKEGKFHQIKRMFKALGKSVINLKRISIHTLNLDPSLGPGEYRELTELETSDLKNLW